MNAAARSALDQLTLRLRHCDSTNEALRRLTDLIEADDSSLYDPVKDCFAVLIPGDLARDLRALADGTAA